MAAMTTTWDIQTLSLAHTHIVCIHTHACTHIIQEPLQNTIDGPAGNGNQLPVVFNVFQILRVISCVGWVKEHGPKPSDIHLKTH
jgi:hypothetical protein